MIQCKEPHQRASSSHSPISSHKATRVMPAKALRRREAVGGVSFIEQSEVKEIMTASGHVDAPVSAAPGALHSRFVQRVRRRHADALALLAPGLPTAERLAQAHTALMARHGDAAVALRVLRQLVLERLAVLDCEAGTPLADITQAMTDLAEFALEVASTEAQRQLDDLYGRPLNAAGGRCDCWIVGMGKFGARELNVSSDIDLIYVYDDDGETAGNAEGRNRISNHEYFAKLVRQVQALIGDTSEHGFVFRVDLALRPNGNSGPPAVSLGALEEYFQVQHAQRIEHVVVEVAAKHERRDQLAQRQARAVGDRCLRGHHPALEPGKALPLAALHLEILFQRAQ
jgi:glutamate-ammonia-ligase adenylyltransferase